MNCGYPFNRGCPILRVVAQGGDFVSLGKHSFRSNDPQSGVVLETKPGEQYYLRVEIAAGVMKGHGRLVLISREQASYELVSTKLSLDANKAAGVGRSASTGSGTDSGSADQGCRACTGDAGSSGDGIQAGRGSALGDRHDGQ